MKDGITVLPWVDTPEGIVSMNGHMIAYPVIDEDSVFIVRACNSYDQLVEALKLMLLHPEPAQFGSADNYYRAKEANDKAKASARAALAAAEGEGA